MSAAPRAVLVLVTYGHQALLPATLDALHGLDYPSDRVHIVLLDNGDGACAALAATRGVETIVPRSNLGFAGGSNAAVAASDGDVVVLVNPDLRPRPDFLTAIVAALDDREVGAAGARLLYEDGRTIQHAGGWLEQPRLTAQHWGWGEPDDGRWDRPRDVEFVTGAALAVRRDVWDRLGGLDASFAPAYYEDVDFCLRLRSAGLRVRYEPRSTAIHLEAAALGRATPAYHRLYHRNRLRLLWKHEPDDELVRRWLPAELAYLRAASDDAEIAALMDAYVWWQAGFVEQAGDRQTSKPTNQQANKPTTSELVAGASPATTNSKLTWLLDEVQRKQAPVAAPFRSRLPLVARMREALSRLVVAEYVRPLTQQQNDFNASTAQMLAALAEQAERQQRTTDAAIACQAMVLAKMIRSA